MNIYVNYENEKIKEEIENKVENIENISRDILIKALKSENIVGNFELSISFVSNDKIQDLNRYYREKNNVTDVLSFPMVDFKERNEKENITEELLGDVVISFEIVKKQSLEYNHSIEREISYLICHSIFHLLGYNHMEKEEKETMRRKEKELMSNIGVYKS